MTYVNHNAGRGSRQHGERASQAGGCAAPRAVTRGERKNDTKRSVLIDHLAFTFDSHGVSIPDILGWLKVATGHTFSGIPGGGIHGFTESLRLVAHVEAGFDAVGYLAWGGTSQAGRMWLQLAGAGCALVRDWAAMHALVSTVVQNHKITRVDLAKDLMQGERTVEDAIAAYKAGLFGSGGNMPSSRLDGDWLNVKDGRTVYVGKAKNGKMLRVYEKGRQLGDPDSPWTRFEVQIGARDRVIPAEVLLQPTEYFAGAYPYLRDLVDAFPEIIRTTRAEGELSLARLLGFLKKSYGRVINAAVSLGADPVELVHQVRLLGLPRRVSLASVSAGVSWSDVADRLQIEGVPC